MIVDCLNYRIEVAPESAPHRPARHRASSPAHDRRGGDPGLAALLLTQENDMLREKDAAANLAVKDSSRARQFYVASFKRPS